MLTPLSGGQATWGYDGSSNDQEEIWDSRYDIAGLNAGLTWADYADIINTFRFGGGSTAAHPDWVSSRFGRRFRAHPFALGYAADKATFAAYASQQVPIFLPGCTQFIVEFAGDYVSQDANGNVTNTNALDVSNPSTWGLDGVIDYDVVTVKGNQVRQIHWYGYPRKTDGTNNPINVRSGDVTTVSQKRADRADPQDVVTGLMPFEFVPDDNTYDCGWTKDMLFMQDGSNPPVSLAPKLIRITVTITDPEGRMRDGMTRQFIFPVKHVSY